MDKQEAMSRNEKETRPAPDPALLSAVLAAREARWQRRMELAEDAPSLVSLTLCLPLSLRTDPEAKAFLRKSAARLEEDLREEGLGPFAEESLEGEDGLTVFISCRSRAESLKLFCVKEEETLPAGRLLDMDVTGRGGRIVGRAELGLPPRKCFLCGRPAAECVAGSRHAPAEIAVFAEKMLKEDGEAEVQDRGSLPRPAALRDRI